MNREIKFRAWDKSCNKMRGIIGLQDCFSLRSDGVCNEDYILLQFTGLKDKNGIDIYDGDIVKRIANMRDYSDADGTEEELLEVFYSGIELLPFSETGVSMEEYEVIGNIHENPELLK